MSPGNLTGCLYFSSAGGGGNEWVSGYGIAGGDIFEASSYSHSPGVSASSPPAQYMHPRAYSHTHILTPFSQVTLAPGSLAAAHFSRAAAFQRDPGLHLL